MSIKVHLYSNLQTYTDGRNVVEVNGSTIGECLNDLVKQFPEVRNILLDKQDKLLDQVFISINLQSPYREQIDKQVKDGDDLYIGLIIAGG